MTPAIAKLKAKLFSRISPAEIGVDPETEEFVEGTHASYRWPATLGGLQYTLSGFPDTFIEIKHSDGKRFNIFILIKQPNVPPRVRMAFETDFDYVDLEARRAIDVVRTDER